MSQDHTAYGTDPAFRKQAIERAHQLRAEAVAGMVRQLSAYLRKPLRAEPVARSPEPAACIL